VNTSTVHAIPESEEKIHASVKASNSISDKISQVPVRYLVLEKAEKLLNV
jgi:hypothetical protein